MDSERCRPLRDASSKGADHRRRETASGAVKPRPVVLLVLCFEAGLATVLARFPAPPLVMVALAAAASLLYRHALAWLTAAAAVESLHGAVARAGARDWCAAR